MVPELFAARRLALTTRLLTLLGRQFLGLQSYRDADRRLFVAAALPLVRGTQRTLAALIAAQHAQDAARQLGRGVAPPPMPDDVSVDLRGVDAATVYGRPFTTVYTELARGQSLPVAVTRGARRLLQVAEGDMQLTHAHASRAAVRELGALYWRRTLIGPENCALCVLTSTMKYKREDLKPIHPACNCEVVAVYKREFDPVQNEAELITRAHAAARAATGQSDAGGRKVDYRQIRTRITAEHGEMGTVLKWPGDHFTDEDEALTA